MAGKKVAFKIVVLENGKMEFVGPDGEKIKPTKDLSKIPKVKMNEIQTCMFYIGPCINGYRWICSPITGRCRRVPC